MRSRFTRFALDSIERAGKTFVQAYLALWILRAGFLDSAVETRSDAYDLLFTIDNVKAGVVGVALSLATSLGSKQLAGRRDSASLVD